MRKLRNLLLIVLLLGITASCSLFDNGEVDTENTTIDDTLSTIMPTGAHPGSLVHRYVYLNGNIYSTFPNSDKIKYVGESSFANTVGSVDELTEILEAEGLTHVGRVEVESPDVPDRDFHANGFFTGDEIYKNEENGILVIISESIVSWYNDWPEEKKTYEFNFLREVDETEFEDNAKEERTMRSEEEMFNLILSVAEADDRIRLVSMNGSRTNPNVPKDKFQDYDIVYIVNDIDSFKSNNSWIDIFGPRIILQMPEAMDMFPAELGNWFSYLMLFEDGTRIDLILIPIEELELYLQDDKLIKILLDKDNLIPELPQSTDEDYWVKKPSYAFFDDCCNEFWWLSTYVAKGLYRNEIIYAIDHLHMMRNLLLTMVSWKVGIEINFSASVGKNYKYLKNYISEDEYTEIMSYYNNSSKELIWNSLWKIAELFRKYAKIVSEELNYTYPDYDEKVSKYLGQVYENSHQD